MPTYDYECGACGHTFEHFQSMSSRRLRKCPDCGERKLERLFGTGAGVIFKGSGFYETDYKRAGESARRSEAASSSDSKTSDSKTSDSKTSDSKTSDSKTSDSKTSDSKGSDSKGSVGKSSSTSSSSGD